MFAVKVGRRKGKISKLNYEEKGKVVVTELAENMMFPISCFIYSIVTGELIHAQPNVFKN